MTEDDRASRWPEPGAEPARVPPPTETTATGTAATGTARPEPAPVDPAAVETAATEPAPSQPHPTEPPRARLRFRGQIKVNSQAKPPTADRPADPPPVPPAPAR